MIYLTHTNLGKHANARHVPANRNTNIEMHKYIARDINGGTHTQMLCGRHVHTHTHTQHMHTEGDWHRQTQTHVETYTMGITDNYWDNDMEKYRHARE